MYKTDTGLNAGTIWHLLADNGALSINEIKEYTKFDKQFIYLALGWLAREDKISFFESDGTVKVTLPILPSDIYF